MRFLKGMIHVKIRVKDYSVLCVERCQIYEVAPLLTPVFPSLFVHSHFSSFIRREIAPAFSRRKCYTNAPLLLLQGTGMR